MAENLNFLIEAKIINTIGEMQKVVDEGNHVALRQYVEKYKTALNDLNNKSDHEKIQILKRLSGSARGCLEFTSDYTQEFLKKMSETEALIKQFSTAGN